MSNDLERRISLKVFEEVGITIDSKDPIYALALICKEIIREDKENYIDLQQNIIHEIRNIPRALGETIEKIVLSVEEAENTTQALCDSTQKLLRRESDSVVVEARKALDVIAKEQVSVALSQMNLSFSALEVRAKALGAEIKPRGPGWLSTIALSAALLMCLVFFPPAVYFQVQKNAELDDQVSYFAKELIALERSVSKLPKSTQDSLKKLTEKERTALE